MLFRSYLIKEEDLTNETLLAGVNYVFEHKDDYISVMKKSVLSDATETIVKLMEEVMEEKKNKTV